MSTDTVTHHTLSRPASIYACELRGLSHESLACLAANLLHTASVSRDMLHGAGLVEDARELLSDAIAQSGVIV